MDRLCLPCARAGFEARGLIFGAPLALALGCAFVPLRKPGKLPGESGGTNSLNRAHGACVCHTAVVCSVRPHQQLQRVALRAGMYPCQQQAMSFNGQLLLLSPSSP